MARLSLAELDGVKTFSSELNCRYCKSRFGEAGYLSVADLMAAINEHKAVCPNWPSPRSRTAQCRPMAGQMTIPLPE